MGETTIIVLEANTPTSQRFISLRCRSDRVRGSVSLRINSTARMHWSFTLLLWICTLNVVSSALLQTTTQALFIPTITRTTLFLPRSHVGRSISSSRLHSEPTKKSSEEKDGDTNSTQKGVFDFVLNPYRSKIPEEIRKEIYQAEANTPAARERGKRIALYATVSFIGLICAFFNVFLSELRNGPVMEDGFVFDMEAAGFGWVNSNFLFQFLFTNKIGGGICLLGGAACGLLAEAEFDTRRINAEKIYEELQRRRAAKLEKDQKKINKISKKRRSSKEAKRLGALAEVIMDEDKVSNENVENKLTQGDVAVGPAIQVDSTSESSSAQDEKKQGGIVDKLKEYYQKADSMAATQALLLNKKLEDEGLIEKITDESGLRVIGLDAATKLKQQQQQQFSTPESKDKE